MRHTLLIGWLGLTALGCAAPPPASAPPEETYDLVYLSNRDGVSHLYRLDLSDGGEAPLTRGDSSVYAPRWLGEARRLVFASNATRPVALQAVDLAGTALPFRIANPAGDETPDWTPDGAWSVYSGEYHAGYGLIIGDSLGRPVQLIRPGEARVKQARFSPTKPRKIAFVSDSTGQQDIYTVDFEYAPVFTNHTRHPALEGHPEWSPDGQHLLFYRYENGDADLFVLSIENDTVRNLTQSDGNELVGRWSPDGAWIAFGSARSGDWELYRVRPDGTDLERLTYSAGFDGDPVWVPR